VYPVPDPLLLRKSGSAGNRTRDHRGGLTFPIKGINIRYIFITISCIYHILEFIIIFSRD
jgi:hypothetical protein